MKSFVLAMTLVLSASAFANTATEAVSNLIASGTYQGKNGAEKCTVSVTTSTDSVTIAIQDKNNKSDYFSLLNSYTNYNVDAVTGEISASQKLSFPRYLQGGSKILNVRGNDKNQVEFFISQILLDHRGNDASTYAACTVSL